MHISIRLVLVWIAAIRIVDPLHFFGYTRWGMKAIPKYITAYIFHLSISHVRLLYYDRSGILTFMSRVARKRPFGLSVESIYHCACPAPQHGHMSSSLIQVSPWPTVYVSEHHWFRQDCADVQSCMNLCCSHMQ